MITQPFVATASEIEKELAVVETGDSGPGLHGKTRIRRIHKTKFNGGHLFRKIYYCWGVPGNKHRDAIGGR